MRVGKYRISLKGKDLLLLIILGAFCLYYYLEVRALPKPEINMVMVGPVFYVFAVLFVVYLMQSIKIERINANDNSEPQKMAAYFKENAKIYFIIIAGICYGLLFSTIGFLLATILFMFVTMKVLGVKSWVQLIAIPLATAIAFWVFFELWLDIALPSGWFSLNMFL